MKVSTQKRIASRVLKVGETRIWVDPTKIPEVSEAITTGDVKRLIKNGAIKKLSDEGTSRARARKIDTQKSKGKRKGQGNRKGKSTARRPKKESWMITVRSLRRELRELDSNDTIDHSNYRKLYRMIGAGTFRSKAHLHLYLREHEMIKKGANQ